MKLGLTTAYNGGDPHCMNMTHPFFQPKFILVSPFVLTVDAWHTPRVNGEIPDVNDATLDHERLAERLATYDLAELQIEGDGNCQANTQQKYIRKGRLEADPSIQDVYKRRQ
ncbi:hypothetical protein CK203_094658 [Vitis vinifera]|uniref:Uncharacterized protein n=1 Tax=Vitis vinifera TaxID=29760 RepID=A0A438CL35_VITVI|nr:hypothetical protein CK203_094658 [Vitis vinifera]